MDVNLNEYFFEMNKGLAVKKEVKFTLEECLQDATKDRLNKIAGIYDVVGRSKMNKGKLVIELGKVITDFKELQKNLVTLDNDQDNLIKSLIENESIDSTLLPVNTYLVLYGKGIVFTYIKEDKIVMVMPNEIKDSISRIDVKELEKEKNRYRLLESYISAFVNLYGIFEEECFINTFNSQNNEVLTVDEFNNFLAQFMEKSGLVQKYNGHLIHEALLEGEGLEELEAELTQREYCILTKEELLKYSDEFYMEITPAHEAFKNYVLDNFCNGDLELAQGILEDICLALVDDSLSVEGAIYELERRDIAIKNANQVREYVSCISEVNNNTRKWALRGATPNELGLGIDNTTPTTIIKEKEPGRNEPCPCNSGKKYKKCCGK